MLYHYLTIARRNLLRHKLFSFVNLFGLALGMAGTLVIGLWVRDELSVDRFYPDLDRLYYVRISNGDWAGQQTSGPLADALKKDIPEIEKATKLSWPNNLLIKVGEKAHKEKGYYVSGDFFDVFQFPALRGNPAVALQSPGNIIITRKVARTYFGTIDPVGRILKLDNAKTYVVGAVIENIPPNSSLRFDWVVNFSVFEQDWMRIWSNNFVQTYAKLRPRVTQAQAEKNMRPLIQKYDPSRWNKDLRPILQPLSEVYLYGEYRQGKPTGGRIEYLRLFSMVALFTLLIACVNFMNLSTARSATRAREVGVRKAVGAARTSLMKQFMGESTLMTLLALALALGMVSLVLPGVNELTQKTLSLNVAEPAFWLGLLALVFVTGFVAGSYPALFLSSLRPVEVLKGTLKMGAHATWFRQSLVVFQFTLSIFLIVGMLTVAYQMHYVRTKHLGLDRTNVFYVPIEGDLAARQPVFRQELLRSGAVSSVTAADLLPIDVGSNTSGNLVWPGKDPNQLETVWQLTVGYDFIQTMNISLVDGRDFRAGLAGDSANILVNESAAKLMGLKNPVGQPITFQGQKGRIIGLMKDFHLASLHTPIGPLVVRHHPDWTSYLLIKTQPGQTAQAIRAAEQIARRLNPNYPFDYHFVDEDYEKLYRNESLINRIIQAFGAMAIVISCLGLFGLAAFTAERRTKEIGIRKVLGAGVSDIVALLSGDFLKLVLIANLIAWPLAYYAMRRWLEGFTYRIDMGWWIFGLAGVSAVLIALLTVGYQAIKAAVANPVESLRTE
ncbi:MAG: ABC transporter permease [Ferruginibacter sp.]|nr:ABC transporter permease [Cytophagales bacterium]